MGGLLFAHCCHTEHFNVGVPGSQGVMRPLRVHPLSLLFFNGGDVLWDAGRRRCGVVGARSSKCCDVSGSCGVLDCGSATGRLCPGLRPKIGYCGTLVKLSSPYPPYPMTLKVRKPGACLSPVHRVCRAISTMRAMRPSNDGKRTLMFDAMTRKRDLSGSVPANRGSLHLLNTVGLLTSSCVSICNMGQRAKGVSMCHSEFASTFTSVGSGTSCGLSFGFVVRGCVRPSRHSCISERLGCRALLRELSRRTSFGVRFEIIASAIRCCCLLVTEGKGTSSCQSFMVTITYRSGSIATHGVCRGRLRSLLTSVARTTNCFRLSLASSGVLGVKNASTLICGVSTSTSVSRFVTRATIFVPMLGSEGSFVGTFYHDSLVGDCRSNRMRIAEISHYLCSSGVAELSGCIAELLLGPSGGRLRTVLCNRSIAEARRTCRARMDVIRALDDGCLGMCLVGPERGALSIVGRRSHSIPTPSGGRGGACPCSLFLSSCVQGHMCPSSYAVLRRSLRLSGMVDILSNRSRCGKGCQVGSESNVRCCRFHFVGGRSSNVVILKFLGISSIIRSRVERRGLLGRTLSATRHTGTRGSGFLSHVSRSVHAPLGKVVNLVRVSGGRRGSVKFLGDGHRGTFVSTDRLLSLVGSMLSVSGVRRNKLMLGRRPFSLVECRGRARVLVSVRTRGGNVSFAIRVTPRVCRRPFMCNDPLRVHHTVVGVCDGYVGCGERGKTVRARVRTLPSRSRGLIYE